jgi:hypothetical protein
MNYIDSEMEQALDSEGMSEQEVKIKNFQELKNDLIRINYMINHPAEFIKNKPANALLMVKGWENLHYPERKLLERKKIILNRIQELTSTNMAEQVQDVTKKIPEEEIREGVTKELNVLFSKYKKELQEFATSETEAQLRLEQQRLDGLERKSKIWLSFLQRESAASIVGAVVLLLLTFSLIVGMVFGWESQVLSNGFLVILGYFFGQSSSRNNKDNDAGGNM